jgi:hypothetical protein
MISSATDICNLALGHLGEARITSLEEDSVAARACALHYRMTRDQVLRSHRWNFAQTRAVLSRMDSGPAFGWSYQYELPADCVRVLEVNDSEAGDVITDEYLIEGRVLLTNAGSVNLVYLRRIEDVSQFDMLFVDVLAVKLAMVLSETIRGTTAKSAELAQMYERVTAPLARRVDSNEGRRRKGLLAMNSLVLRERGTGFGSLGWEGAGHANPAHALAVHTHLAEDISDSTEGGRALLRGVIQSGTQLASIGQAHIDVTFENPHGSSNWRFLELVLVSAASAPTEILHLGPVVKTSEGFRAFLTGEPGDSNLTLHYKTIS